MSETLATYARSETDSSKLACLTADSTNEPESTYQEQIEFLTRVNNSITEINGLANDTFCLLARHLPSASVAKAVASAASTHATLGGNLATAADGVAKAVASAASTHATLGGNLATAADGVAKAVASAASTHATLGGNLATAADGVAKAVASAASTHATLGGNLATAADGVAKAVASAASTHATLGGNLATAADGVAKAVASAASTHATLGGNLATAADGVAKAVASAASTHATLGNDVGIAAESTSTGDEAVVDRESVDRFRNLVLTMLGELPRRGHLTSDFDQMFSIAYDKQVTAGDFRRMGQLMVSVREDWTSDEFLKGPVDMIARMRTNLLDIAAILDIHETVPSTFGQDELAIVPHISLLNDFTDHLLRQIGDGTAGYQEGIENNPNLLESAKSIVRGHRDTEAPLPLKMLRTAILENTAQARIRGLRIVAEPFGLSQHPYLTSHDVVEEYHGRDSLEQLRSFVKAGTTPIVVLEAKLDGLIRELQAFYASMLDCVHATTLDAARAFRQ